MTPTTDDDAGRTIETIQNYAAANQNPPPGPDKNIITGTDYNVHDLVASTRSPPAAARKPPTTSTTPTATTSSPALFCNDQVTAVIYADSTQHLQRDHAQLQQWQQRVYDRVQYTYDRQGEMTSMEDQNQTTHAYAYDGGGHLLSDSVTRARRQSGRTST